MSYYNEKIGLGKLGVNFIRSITDENKCYFNEVKQENDVGIDAFIEFTKNGENDGKCIAVQIKTGAAYFNKSKSLGNIPIGNHYHYWKRHTLPVYGIVYDNELNIAYWVSISDYLKSYSQEIESGERKNISFPLMEINLLNKKTFETIFKKIIYREIPKLSFKQTIQLSNSNYSDERVLAVKILANRYANRIETWEKLFELLDSEEDEFVLFQIIKYISYIPHHPDLWGDLNFTDESKKYGVDRIKSFDYPVITKLLSQIGERGIERGTIGQCVESIISLLPNRKTFLIKIISETDNNIIALNAFFILAYYDSKYIIQNELFYINKLGEMAATIVGFCKEFGGFDLYI